MLTGKRSAPATTACRLSRNGGAPGRSIRRAVVNVANPGSHVDVTQSMLFAGKHVYSEKSMTLNIEGADMLAKLAEEQGVLLVSAPCSPAYSE
ncbi:Gfo/Idh/MocA family oxidoreductase [Streptomyces sp. AC550_RSS872]|uniref:Gfo/Idh/MocA family oxidoreductase n=1 Tax=Streptomyces sp. AC550_RSS872 TaxID=2823689 RepID=UPI0035AB94B7